MIDKLDKILIIIKNLIIERFTGTIELTFNCGGVRGIKKIRRENIEIN